MRGFQLAHEQSGTTIFWAAALTNTTLDHSGENVTTFAGAEQSSANAPNAIGKLAALNANATFSIKLTHFGLDISTQDCFRNMERLVALASRLGSCVEVDMESSEYGDRTL